MTLLSSNDSRKPSKPSPASVLAKLYGAATAPELAAVGDFTKLLKHHGFEEIKGVINWLADEPDHVRLKSSSWFAYKFRWLKLEASSNLTDYPVGPDAAKIKKRIHGAGGDPIPSEFVQHCLDNYAAFLEYLRTNGGDSGKLLYEHFDPPTEFAFKWFAVFCPTYSNAYRKFTVAHEAFRKYTYKIADACSSRNAMDKLLKAYKDDSSQRVS